ncbi:unnamed protein product, partial [Rotaria magnacalcarata]
HNEEDFSFSQQTLEKIIEIGKITENNQVALAILKILNFNEKILSDIGQKFEEFEETLDNILPQISQEETKLILLLSDKLKTINNSSLLKFLHQTLIDNPHSTKRKEALEILQSSKVELDNLKYIKETIKLEEKCLKNDSSIVGDCLKHVKTKNKLTLNCFEELKKYFHVNQTIQTIVEIIEQEIQNLPKCFIE